MMADFNDFLINVIHFGLLIALYDYNIIASV